MSRARIVLVEDNPLDVMMVRELLKDRGFTLLEHYSNGEDAAKAIAAMIDAPKLFLLDLNVPRVHGLELLRIIRSCPAVSEAPVAILTSSQDPEDRVRSDQYGANAYIVKPQGFHEFMTSVGTAVSNLLTLETPGNCCSRVSLSHVRRNPRASIRPIRVRSAASRYKLSRG